MGHRQRASGSRFRQGGGGDDGGVGERGVSRLRAHIHPEHEASMAVARSVGLAPTDALVDGETRWES